MSQDTERLSENQIEEILRDYTPNAFMHRLAREVQASRKLVAAARVLAAASEAEMIRLTDMAYPNGDFQCPADPCPYCTAQDEFAIALMDYEDGA